MRIRNFDESEKYIQIIIERTRTIFLLFKYTRPLYNFFISVFFYGGTKIQLKLNYINSFLIYIFFYTNFYKFTVSLNEINNPFEKSFSLRPDVVVWSPPPSVLYDLEKYLTILYY